MARVTTAEVQAWLSGDRHVVTEDDLNDQLEELVLTRCAESFDVSTWTNAATTPELVRSVIACLTAAFFVRKVYADQDEDPAYADKLERLAWTTLGQIETGKLTLQDVDEDVLTEVQEQYTAGVFPGDDERLEEDGDHIIRFTMGEVF